MAGCATFNIRDTAFDDPGAVEATDRARARWAGDTLVRFEGEGEFRRYLADVWRAGRARGEWWAFTRSDRIADDGGQTITVTGSRINPRNPSITNVQEAGVDEGDIVKQIDRFLLVLQDGRIFVVDTQAGDGRTLAVTDQMDVYRGRQRLEPSDIWYDEMLVYGDRVVVTGYSYPDNASELSVFRLSPAGRLEREGTFFMSSNDYYSRTNYASRLVRGNLIVYTPLRLTEIRPDRPFPWPAVRRWQPGQSRRSEEGALPFVDASQVYRPVLDSREPVIHTISVCPLGADDFGADLECRSTAFVGPYGLIYYSPDDAYLWLVRSYEDEEDLVDDLLCGHDRPRRDDVVRSLIYRIPLAGDLPGMLALRGVGSDQFSMQARDGELRALTYWPSVRCSSNQERPDFFTFFSTPLEAFGPELREADADSYTTLPGITDHYVRRTAHRFTDTHLVYAPLGRARFYDDQRPRPSEVVVVPVDRPGEARVLAVPHNVIRAEQAGTDIVLTGYADVDGLSASLIDLDGPPRVASTHRFAERHESEGRSHAFNSLVAADGSGLMGFPTVPRQDEETRVPWRSRASDVSFLAVDRSGRLSPAGHLIRGIDYDEDDRDGVPGYECQVSCIDWYGNSRPIFTDGRIFALAGAELIEGRIDNGEMREVQRLNVALASTRLSRAARSASR